MYFLACAGTVSYCAPELLKEGKLTKAADVYSFAMMMWEMYSGTALFRGMNSSQVRRHNSISYSKGGRIVP